MEKPLIINNDFLDSITDQAKNNPRLRMNYNLHKSFESNAQKMVNSLEPGTQIPIHRHQSISETYIVLRGAIKVFFTTRQDNYLPANC